MIDPKDFLLSYFNAKGSDPQMSDGDKLAQDFFDSGLIDSFGVIELISAIESQFNISFSPENMQDKRFRTIKGLSEIINELIKSKDK